MTNSRARNWLLASACVLLAMWPPLALEGKALDESAIDEQIAQLLAGEEKSFDDLVRLALLNRKVHDERLYGKWLAAAAATDPAAAFTSERSPFVYVRAWTTSAPEDTMYLSIAKTGDGAFYAALCWGRRMQMRGVDRIDPLTREIQRIPIHEQKAEYAPSLAAAYDNTFYLSNNGITFCFAPDGAYLGQVVTMHRHKLLNANPLLQVLDGGNFLVCDRYRHLGRMNRHADTLRYIKLKCSPSAAVTGMAADKDDNLVAGLVADNQLLMLQPDLSERCRIGGTGTGPGKALAVTDLAACNQSIIAADPVLGRTQIFDRNGAYLMTIPAAGYSLSINDRGTILALEGARVACYVRVFKDEFAPPGEFASYFKAIKLMEEGKTDQARELLKPLTDSTDANLAQVSRSLMEHETLALARHYEPPRFLTKPEAERLVKRKIGKLFLDAYDRCLWASLPDGFLIRIDEFERTRSFEVFPALHGLAGKLLVDGMRLYPGWCYAATNHGICRYSRKDGDWQFLPGAETLDDVSPDGR